MSICKGTWGEWKVLDEDGNVVAVVDSSEEAAEVLAQLNEAQDSTSSDGDFLGLF